MCTKARCWGDADGLSLQGLFFELGHPTKGKQTMKRIIAAAFTAALATATLAIVASPASAHGTDVCAGSGRASVSAAVYYPTSGPSAAGATASFSFNVAGGCVAGHVSASVTLSAGVSGGAYCGNSNGVNGTVDGGHSFTYVSAGSVLVVSGNANGVVNAVPDASQGQSCVSGAVVFLVQGLVSLV